MISSILDRIVLGLVRLVPNKVAHHLMFLVQGEPAIPDSWGYHIRPIHYYEPLPDFRSLKAEQVNRRRDPVAINFNWEQQLNLLRHLSANYSEELRTLSSIQDNAVDFDNDYFAGFDVAVYYSRIRHLTPRRVIEIGSGYSTRVAYRALTRNREQGKTTEAAFGVERTIFGGSLFRFQPRLQGCAFQLLASSRPRIVGEKALALGE